MRYELSPVLAAKSKYVSVGLNSWRHNSFQFESDIRIAPLRGRQSMLETKNETGRTMDADTLEFNPA